MCIYCVKKMNWFYQLAVKLWRRMFYHITSVSVADMTQLVQLHKRHYLL